MSRGNSRTGSRVMTPSNAASKKPEDDDTEVYTKGKQFIFNDSTLNSLPEVRSKPDHQHVPKIGGKKSTLINKLNTYGAHSDEEEDEEERE